MKKLKEVKIKNKIKKLVSLFLVIMIIGMFVMIPRASAKTFVYGNVYLFNTNIPFIWDVLNWKLSPPSLTFELNTNTHITRAVGLVNKGEIVRIFIAIPVERSYIIIRYQDWFYKCPLVLHRIHKHCIVFTFGE